MMKNLILSLLLIVAINHVHTQQIGCNSDRYFNTIFEDVTVTSDVQYGQNMTLTGTPMPLKMDIYEPTGDVLSRRPVIVLAHGNGGVKEGMAWICEDFAQRGFVTATISYRPVDLTLSDSLIGIGLTMALHDMKAAIRFFREDAATSDNYKVDPDFIFAGGISLGASLANTAGYMDSLDNIPPDMRAMLNALGGMEGNSSSNTQYSSAVQGVLNYAGFIPKSHFIDAHDPPLYSFHDEFDLIVPCGFDPIISPFHGSCDMHAAADTAGIKNKFYLRAESNKHVGWSYGTILYESAQFLGEILCENLPPNSWSEVGTGLNKHGDHTFNISAVDENIIWTTPYRSLDFSRTTDGGQSWTTGTIPVSDSTYRIVDIQAFNADTAIAMLLSYPGLYAGTMCKTTDGGMTWTEQTTAFANPNEGPKAFHFFNENEGFALGRLVFRPDFSFSSHVGYVTQNGGTTWYRLTNNVYPVIAGERLFVGDPKILEVRGDHLWFGTRNGMVYHSANRGLSWTSHLVETDIAIQSVAFKDEWNGIAVSGNQNDNKDISKAYSTSDGGMTWTEIPVPITPRPTSIYFVEGSATASNSCGTYMIFYGHRSTSGTSISKDGGMTWELVSQQPAFDIEFTDPETGWMGGMIHGANGGGLYKWDGSSLEGNLGCTTSAMEHIISSQDMIIYPNPASDKVHIQLDNDWKGTLDLQIINLLGQVVHRERVEKPGRILAWEIDDYFLSPGTYQLLLTNGLQMKVKSLVKI